MKIKDENTIILFSVVFGLLLWLAAAAVDSLLFSRVPLLESLRFDISSYELFARSLFLAGFVVLALLASSILKKLRLTEERYRDLVELSNDIVSITDREGKYVFMNDAAYSILEFSPEEVIGKSFMELWHREDRNTYLEKLEELVKLNTDTFIFENRYITKRGKAINVLQTVRVLKDRKGTVIGTQSIAKDITERKQVEESLQKAITRAEDEKARSEAILSAIDEGISIQSMDFKVLYQNQAYMNMSGGDKRGEFCYQAYSPGDSLCPGCPVKSVFMDGKIHTLENEMSRNGEVRIIEISASPLRDSCGNIVAGIETIRDITARKSAEAKLRMFSVAIEEAMDGIQIIDLDGSIVYSNKAVSEIYGFSHEELVGKPVSAMIADREFAFQSIISKSRDAGRWSGELVAVHKDGKTFPVWLSLSVVKGEHGRPIAMIVSLQNITERKQAEGIVKRNQEQMTMLVEERTRELLIANEKLSVEIADRGKMEQELLKAQKFDSLGILADGIAHDFNNLLSSIMGNISLAMLDLDPEKKAYRQLEGAEKASLQARDLTRKLLSLSRGGSPVKITVAIGDLIREVTGFVLRESRVKLFFSLPEDLRLVDVDEGQISQVLHALIVNASRAMPGGGTITISCENAVVDALSKLPLRQGDYVRINIRDHGVGISPANLSKLFNPDVTTKPKENEIGLATSYSVIKQHGGHIYAESELGNGTTVIIYLPASSSGKTFEKFRGNAAFHGHRNNTAEG